MLWIITKESKFENKLFFHQLLGEYDFEETKCFLINFINKSIITKEISNMKDNFVRKFQKTLTNSKKNDSFARFSVDHLIQVLINFFTIQTLVHKFYSVYFELNPDLCLVSTLDLSDIEYEVRGWKSEFRNNITDLSEITGLQNLKQLKSLDLSNNSIEDLGLLKNLKSLTHLDIANNRVRDIKNLDTLEKLENLEFLDISGNIIAQYISDKKLQITKQIINRRDFFM